MAVDAKNGAVEEADVEAMSDKICCCCCSLFDDDDDDEDDEDEGSHNSKIE